MLKITRIEERVAPGNKLVQCLSESFHVRGVRTKFPKGEPIEVTQNQFDYLMMINASLGRVIFQEYKPRKLVRNIPSDQESVQNLFANMPGQQSESVPPIELEQDPVMAGVPAFPEEFDLEPTERKPGLEMQIAGMDLPKDQDFSVSRSKRLRRQKKDSP